MVSIDAETLSKSDMYRDKKCSLCERKHPETVLNIEAVIHHGNDYQCYDRTACTRAQRRLRLRKMKC